MNDDSVKSNSEILFIYETRLCNPNGDPDSENKPRIDVITGRNYVTDVRLKRFFRDYIINRMGEKYIWVTKIEGQNVDATERLTKSKKEHGLSDPRDVIKFHIDARLFGATIPLKGKAKDIEDAEEEQSEEIEQMTERKGRKKEGKQKAQGESYHVVGPVQFSLGYSLHKVEMMTETSTITSVFTGAVKTGERQYGNIGKDWRVYYSLIAFYGVVSAARAEHFKTSEIRLRERDIMLLDNLLWDSIMRETITRSKIGHFPHLYIRLKHKDSENLIGDLRRFIDEDFETNNVRSLGDLKISFTRLFSRIQSEKDNLDSVFLRVSDDFEQRFAFKQMLQSFGENLKCLPHENVKLSDETLLMR